MIRDVMITCDRSCYHIRLLSLFYTFLIAALAVKAEGADEVLVTAASQSHPVQYTTTSTIHHAHAWLLGTHQPSGWHPQHHPLTRGGISIGLDESMAHTGRTLSQDPALQV